MCKEPVAKVRLRSILNLWARLRFESTIGLLSTAVRESQSSPEAYKMTGAGQLFKCCWTNELVNEQGLKHSTRRIGGSFQCVARTLKWETS